MYRFFADKSTVSGNIITISGQDAHHIKNVLRMKTGDNIYVSLSDGWEYTCEIEEFSDGGVLARITDSQKTARELPSKITLYQCLPKKDKFEQVIQKSVELGVYRIVPVISARCVVKYDPKKLPERLKRWNAIASAAAKQAKRLIEPTVEPVISFKEAVSRAALDDVALIPYEKEEGMGGTRDLLGSISHGQGISFIIGPEGGFEDAEAALAAESGLHPVSLGGRVLRTETAGPALLAILGYLLE